MSRKSLPKDEEAFRIMCAPHIIQHVRRQLANVDILHRAVEESVYYAPSTTGGEGNGRTFSFRRVTDLTHHLSPEFPVFPAFQPMQVKPQVTIEKDGFFAQRWDVGEHTGTHLDAPAHFAQGEGIRTVEEIPVVDLVVPLVVIDIKERADKDDDTELQVDDIVSYEKRYGAIPKGAAVCMYTGWESRVHSAEQFLNADSGGTLHFPGISPEAARYLAEERDIVGVGVDTLSLDFGPSTDFRSHFEILSRNKWGLECLANLGEVPPAGAMLFVGAPKVPGASGGPCRVLALW